MLLGRLQMLLRNMLKGAMYASSKLLLLPEERNYA